MPVHLKIQSYTFTFSDNPLLSPKTIAKVNMHVYLKFGENWTTNMEDMEISLFLQFLSFSFFSLNSNISKTVRGAGL